MSAFVDPRGVEGAQGRGRASVLLAGPRFERQTGGLERALADVARGLAELGFDVDDATGASTVAEADATTRASPRTSLAPLNRHRWLLGHWSRLGAARRRALRDVFLRRASIEDGSRLLRDLDARLTQASYDVVLYCVEEAPPGGLALVLSRHCCVVAIAIEGLAAELSTPAWVERWLRWRARAAHAQFGTRARANAIRCAILSSRAWADATVDAGLARGAAHAVYFGVPIPGSVRPERAFAGRLLYVGRLVKDKGLHLLLAALAQARRTDPSMRLTIVAGDGPAGYRGLLERRIAHLGLAGAIDWRGPVARACLPALFAEHDALVFWSPFAEPAPLVAMEAMAARLPVIVPRPSRASPIYEDGVTCVMYDRDDPRTLADALVSLAADAARYRRIAEWGAARIRDGFTTSHTAHAYAAIVRDALASAPAKVISPPAFSGSGSIDVENEPRRHHQ